MPELPDITVYVDALTDRVVGQRLQGVRLNSPFVLRSVAPPLDALVGREVLSVERLAKQLVFRFGPDPAAPDAPDQVFAVLHLMVSGRLHWKKPGASIKARINLAAFDFAEGSLTFTEASKKKRASIHILGSPEALAAMDPGGTDALVVSFEAFDATLRAAPHTVKRSLTDQRILAGVGNAYSDEILHRAKLSPFKLPRQMTDAEMRRLYDAMRAVLSEWVTRLRAEVGTKFPEKVTAFRPEMAVHGRYREPCPDCGKPVQRIVYAEKQQSNYCSVCQTEGRLLADRSLSRLLKASWPKTLEELESR